MVANITNQEEELYQSLRPVVSSLGVDLIDVAVRKHHGETVVKIVIDSEDGVGTRDCEDVSSQVAPVIEVENPQLFHDAQLEVSSPGLKRRIRRPEELKRFEGREVKVKCYAPYQGEKLWKGQIKTHTNDTLTIQTEGDETVTIPLDQIASIRLYFDADEFLASGGQQDNG